MRRSQFDGSKDQAYDDGAGRETTLSCRWCHKPTLVATLMQYGARCFQCYEAYCNEVPRAISAADKRVDGPRGWAHALRARELSGERLTPAARAMWRAAIKLTDEPA